MRRVTVAAACLLLLSGCRLDLVAEATLNAQGAGTVAYDTVFDPAMLAELDALGIDPTAELEARASQSPGWDVERSTEPDGSLRVRVVHEVSDPGQIGVTLRESAAGLAPGDPGLLVDVEVTLDEDGAARIRGDALFRAPSGVGAEVDGAPIGPSGARLAEQVATAVDAEFRIALPGPVVAHDGDRLEDRTVVWDLAVDEPVSIDARSRAPAWWEPALAWVAARRVSLLLGVGGAVAVLGVAAALWRRRVRRAA